MLSLLSQFLRSGPAARASRALLLAGLAALAPTYAYAGVDLAIGMSHTGYFVQATPGGKFTLAVTNNGDAAAASGELSVFFDDGDTAYDSAADTLPTGVTVNSIATAGTSWSCTTAVDSTAFQCTWDAALGVAETTDDLVVSVDVGAAASDPIGFDPYARYTGTDDTPADNSLVSAHQVTLKPEPVLGLAIEKVVDSDTPAQSATINYTITVRNESAVDVTGIEIEDFLPTGVTDNDSETVYPASKGNDSSYSPGNNTGFFDTATNLWQLDLSAGEFATLTIPVTVTAAAGDGVFTNIADITTAPESSVASAETEATAPAATGGADLEIEKSVDVAAPALNDQIVYVLTVTNRGSNTASSVVIQDSLPGDVTYDENTAALFTRPSSGDLGGTPQVNAGEFSWTIPTLADGQTVKIEIPVTVSGGSGQVVTNTATVATDEPNQYDPNAANNQDSVVIAVDGTDLALAKTVSDNVPSQSDVITYTLTLTNNGANDATNVQVLDSLPAEVTYDAQVATYSASDGAVLVTNPDFQWVLPSVAAGATETLDIPVTVNAGDNTVFTNTATISAVDQPDPNADNDTGSVTVAVGGVDLEVTKTANVVTPADGANFRYTLSVTNLSANDATGVSVKDFLPQGVVHQGDIGNGHGNYDEATGTWAIGALNAGAVAEVTIEVSADAAAAPADGTVTNRTAALVADQADPDTSNNTGEATVVIGGADLSIAKSLVPGNRYPGSSAIYTLTVDNLSTRDVSGVVVKDFLPRGVQWDSDVTANGSYDPNTGLWTFASPLTAGSQETLDITTTITGSPGDVVVNTASVEGTLGDPEPSNNTHSLAFTVVEEPTVDMAMSKSVVDGSGSVIATPQPNEGDTVIYRLTVSNAGSYDATDVVVTDQLPSGVTFVSSTAGTYDSNNHTVDATLASVPSGGNQSIDITVTVNQGAGGTTQTNTASILGQGQTETNPGNEIGSVGIAVQMPAANHTARFRGVGLDETCSLYNMGMSSTGAATMRVEDACLDRITTSNGTGLTLTTYDGRTRAMALSSLSVDSAGDLQVGTDVSLIASGTCSGDVVDLTSNSFSGTENCVGTTSISAGTAVTILNGANVTFQAPTVTLSPGFTAAAGSQFHAHQ